MNLDDTPLPMPVQEASMSPDEHLEGLRSFAMEGVNAVVDKALEQIILPDQMAAFLLDVAQFTTFLMAVKIAEARGLDPTTENLMRWYWPMQKALKDEVPGMLRAHAAAAIAAKNQVRQ